MSSSNCCFLTCIQISQEEGQVSRSAVSNSFQPLGLYIPPVYGILQARILEWVAIVFSRGPSLPNDQTHISHIAGRFFTVWAWGFPGGTMVKNPPANAGDMGSITGWGRYPGEGNGNLLQYSNLENSMDRETWCATVHGFPKEWYWKDNGEKPRFLSLKIICHLLGFSCFWWIFMLFSFTVSGKQIQPQRKHGHLWSTYYLLKVKKVGPLPSCWARFSYSCRQLKIKIRVYHEFVPATLFLWFIL